jgi:hypothetical protein
MIICFITPASMVKIASKAAEFIPVCGPYIEYTKKAKTLTQLSNFVSAGPKGVGIMFTFCFGKARALTAECALWLIRMNEELNADLIEELF